MMHPFVKFPLSCGLLTAAATAIILAGCGNKDITLSKNMESVETIVEEEEVEQYASLLDFDFSKAQNDGVRGVWITNVDSNVLESRESIAEMMDRLAEANFNVVYPVMWNKGMTLYPSEVIKRYFGENQPEVSSLTVSDKAMLERMRHAHRIGIDPLHEGRDPLQEIIEEAHRAGLEVVPWFEFGFSSSYNFEGGPILEMYPEWMAIDPDGNLVKKNNFEWMNAFHPDVQQFLTDMIMEVVENYDIDGIQGDDRLPALPSLGGYDEYTVGLYKKEFGTEPPRDIKDPAWVQWRADLLSDFLERLGNEVKAVDEELAISMSPSYYDWSKFEYLQDSYTWTNRGLIDSIHPQAYRKDFSAYASIVDDLVANQFTAEQLPMLSPGILMKSGTYVMPADNLVKSVAYNRMNGINGEVFFFYEGLRQQGDELLNLLKDRIYTETVSLPYRDGSNPWRRPGTIVPVSKARFAGEWVEGETGPEYLHKFGGVDGRIVYEAKVPISGIYDLYMKMPKGQEEYSKNAFFAIPNLQLDLSKDPSEREQTPSLAPGQQPVQIKQVDQSSIANEQWVHLAQVNVEANKTWSAASLLSNETNDTQQTIAGPIMLLLNRKAMRD